MHLMFLPALKSTIHHLNWYFKYWICKMKLFWLIFNTESVLWWRTCLEFKHLEEAFGYFRACTLISLPTYSFGKQFIIGELGRLDLITFPTATQYILCQGRAAFFLQFYCLLIPNAISKPAKSELPLQLEIFFIKWLNLKCPFSAFSLFMSLFPLSASASFNHL